jgi:hypothetical protein
LLLLLLLPLPLLLPLSVLLLLTLSWVLLLVLLLPLPLLLPLSLLLPLTLLWVLLLLVPLRAHAAGPGRVRAVSVAPRSPQLVHAHNRRHVVLVAPASCMRACVRACPCVYLPVRSVAALVGLLLLLC